MANTKEKMEFAYQVGKYSDMSLRTAYQLMRLAATHVRIETELTNGYKKRDGSEDKEYTQKAIAKRDRIDAKMEAIAPIVYGALTVSVRLGDREVYIP